jgi:hypothetical protein
MSSQDESCPNEFLLQSIVVLAGLKSAFLTSSDVSYFTSASARGKFDAKKKRPLTSSETNTPRNGYNSDVAPAPKRRQYKPAEGADKAASFFKGCRVQLRSSGKDGVVVMEKAGGWREILFADGKTSRFRPSELIRVDADGSASPKQRTDSFGEEEALEPAMSHYRPPI